MDENGQIFSVNGQLRLRLMVEWQDGIDPYGQFYGNKVDDFSIGVSLGF